MLKKFKCISLLLVIAVMLQSILMPAISTAEAENVVMEVAVPQLSLKNFSNTSNSVKLVWTSSDNSIKAESYDIYRNNSLVKTSTSVTYTDTELIPETKYTYSVKAKNNIGKVIAESNALAVTTLVESAKTYTASNIAESNISIPNIVEPVNITSSAIILEQIETEELEKMEQSKLFKNGNPDFETDRFIIKYKNENSKITARKAFEKIDKIDNNKKNDLKNNKNKKIDIISLNRKQKLKDFVTYLQKNDLGNDIEYIQPDYQLKLSSNDPYYSRQWGLENTPKYATTSENMTTTSQSAILIDAGVTKAWNVSTGCGITVAVIDTGVDITHEDLSENIWVNNKEIPNNSIDDDGNGKIDDINGWNFSDDNNVVCDNSNITFENHGTHVAGIIAAVKDNGKGIAGVAPYAKVMPLKVFKNGMAYTSDIISAIQYAENMGVRIVNCSWGSSEDNLALKEVIKNSNMLFICAAGNSSMNIDSNPVYPGAFDCSNIITVASVNKYGSLSSFSNYGENSVDVAAPGEEIISTVSGNQYEQKSGTSMATGFISGEAALLLSKENTTTTNDIKLKIINSADRYSTLYKKICSGNMINCTNAVDDKQGICIEINDTSGDTVNNDLYTTTGAIELFSIDSTSTYTSTNLFPQPIDNNGFTLKNQGVFTATSDRCIYKYEYNQNKPYTYHGFDIAVDTNSNYTYSFDAYISPDTNIKDAGTTFIAQGEYAFPCIFDYDNTKKGTWQHFEYTAKPNSGTARLLLYPTTSTQNMPATTGYILYKNVDFKKEGTIENLFPQVTDNSAFTISAYGYFDCKLISCRYDYSYNSNLTWTYHGFDIPVDTNLNYTYSFDAYISLDANIPTTGTTFIAQGEYAFPCIFDYDNTKKGTWQHFEYTAKPNSGTARLLLYPTVQNIPATTGYISYKNVEFKKAGNYENLFPQYLENKDFGIKGSGNINCNANYIYTYEYNQNMPWTYHGFDIPVDINSKYTYSFDAYISPDANIQDTGTTFIAQGESAFLSSFYYDNSKKGTWQHFEYTTKPLSGTARILLYPTSQNIPATTGYISYKNVEFKKEGTNINLFKQVASDNDFIIKAYGFFESIPSHMYSYEYNQNKQYTWHGFEIPVNTNSNYTYSLDAYISLDANIQETGTTFIAQGESGFPCSFLYDNTQKGTWQHFEFTAKPNSGQANLYLYPTTQNIPATTGYILYKNVSFKEVFSYNVLYIYDSNNCLTDIQENGVPIWKFIYDNNGNLIRKQKI